MSSLNPVCCMVARASFFMSCHAQRSMHPAVRALDAGQPTVMDQPLTLALSFVFMHEGLGIAN